MKSLEPQILLTNDDGIDSPGLWAAAEALSKLGYVWVAAPRQQSSGAGRSMPATSDGRITAQTMRVHGKEWTVHAVGGSPAQTVQHAILEIMPAAPDVVVSGINYGLNLGTGVTISGTVGAAMESAAHGIPSLAISLDTAKEYHLSYSREIDFKVAAHFTRYFAQSLISGGFDPSVQLLKVEVPYGASEDTPWEVTRLATARYYVPQPPARHKLDEPQALGYTMETNLELFPEDSDVHVVLGKKHVAVTPLTLDMTAPVDFGQLAARLRHNQG
ncbi:MAG: 5'/3'-nucleotidase SurE [Chloroflexi bacterium]|nr:5'/3'-nucleotidase SurE [Chloroflexota bacterium]